MDPATDERAAAEQEVLKALTREEERHLALANARADTGDALLRLEKACAREGVNRSVWVAGLQNESGRRGLERLTESGIRNRKRMARARVERPPSVAQACLALPTSTQRVVATLPTDRLEEFLRRGVPTVDGKGMPLKAASQRQVVQAVRASRTVPAGQEITPEMVKLPKRERPAWSFKAVAKALGAMGGLTLEQAREILVMVVMLLGQGTSMSRQTTRRLMDSTIGRAAGHERAVPVEQVLEELDGLLLRCQRAEFGSGDQRYELTARACLMVSHVLWGISRWTRPAEREAG